MPHDFVRDASADNDTDNPHDVMFRCSKCSLVIGFNKPGYGEPCAEMVDGEWRTPWNPDQWCGPCESVTLQ